MGKNKKKQTPGEDHLILPLHPSRSTSPSPHPSSALVVDTHTHLLSTFEAYRKAYKPGKYETVWDFARAMYDGHSIEAIIDVWCEAPIRKKEWKEIADSAIDAERRKKDWGGLEYWFVMGASNFNELFHLYRHEANLYTDEVEQDILEAMAHPRCVGWGEIGLDYHYDNSPREVQQQVFIRQLRHAVRLGKSLTIHTREAEEDTERILKAEVPKDHRIHIHCFTDSAEWAQRMQAHFPNLFIGITGVITYTTNMNTSAVVRDMINTSSKLRILLETDAPFMTPSNLYNHLTDPGIKGMRLPLCHSAMIPWVAEFVANVANDSLAAISPEFGDVWSVDKIIKTARDNAKIVYGV
ncbi:hydrolase [Abortiporus biennis]|nr:hydrolase [Abortiporus biennis]